MVLEEGICALDGDGAKAAYPIARGQEGDVAREAARGGAGAAHEQVPELLMVMVIEPVAVWPIEFCIV